MDTLTLVNEWLAGFFACAAIHYGIHWWYSRKEQLFLALAVLCIAYAAFCLAIVSYFRARSIADTQAALDRFVTIGVLSHALVLDFYARLGSRRDRNFRALVTGLLAGLVLLNQWAPLRGTVTELKMLPLESGATLTIPVRTPPGVSLALLYLAVLLVYAYGLFVAHAIWRRAGTGALLIATASAAILAGAAVGFVVDFRGAHAPYVGAWPHAIFVLCAALFLARQYSARGTELRAHRDRLEELVALRTRELTEAKNDADRANGAKTRFLAQISHEIRDPMNVILAHAQSLERDPALLQAQRRKIEIIRASGRHLLSLINDLLEISKIEAGHPELVESAFEPRGTLLAVEQMFTAEAAARGIALTTACAPDLPRELLGDGAKVKQILINLTGNALKFTEEGSIHLGVSWNALAEGSILAQFVVADTGIGIAPEDEDRIFQPFEQLEAGRRAGGTGLGLAISLAHARLMGGDLRVQSSAGAGSTFTFTFVARKVDDEAPAAAPQVPALVARTAARGKVLIVDDEALNREVLAELLTESGFETRTAPDGADALSIHAEWRPELVLIDLRMSGMGGLEAIRCMRAAGSNASIGVLSASVLEDDERQARACGADLFIRKPYDYEELLEQIVALGAEAAV